VDAADAEQLVEDRLDPLLGEHHRTPSELLGQTRLLQRREGGNDLGLGCRARRVGGRPGGERSGGLAVILGIEPLLGVGFVESSYE
jgi:hypothetical protein